ncbi:MAG: prepilin-type N-terminal cleavage/methylation domain-containing protein [Verrucomicrobiota bacterium]
MVINELDNREWRGGRKRRNQNAMTLIEVVLTIAIAVIAVAGIVSGYVCSMIATQKSALSLAANARALARIEEVRSATYKPPVDELVSTNFPDQVVILEQSASGVSIYATNVTQISQISSDPPLKRIRVDCIWNYRNSVLMTNSIETCRAASQ